ncbi:hypothetical protein [Bradyrhizobium lablabi]|uniref:hypothetical protein n=1 Tax=Bradyrhizobium lablabi TaxID=722472 RepID=UPI001BAC37E2|nr:hypothetical protein [Bradyrhizobium lablabi]MBR0694815.1 hypothetical protein [Bradyrhizobium lablabi]
MSSEQDLQQAEAPPEQAPRRSTFRRVASWIAVVWFCCFLIVFNFILFMTTDIEQNGAPPVWVILFFIIGGWVWLASAYWIYDKLFRMAEARWPAAKGIRAILSPLLKSLLLHHHHH